ncbi:MAG TPA: hypothetical protein VF613_02490, partial [Longimicrobium sp.]
SGATDESAGALSTGTEAVTARLREGADGFAAGAGEAGQAAVEGMGRITAAASTAGDQAVAGTAATLDTAASTAATGFGEASGALEQGLAERVADTDTRAREAVSDTRARIAEGQQRVDRHLEESEAEHGPAVQRSVLSDIGDWFAQQLADLWNMLSSWSFWVGLLVTVVLFPVLGPGALIVGGAVGGAVAGIEENVRAGRDWYDPAAILRNAAIGGLAGAAMAVGLVVIAVAGLEGAAAIVAVMALSAAVGIVTNVATGQPWHRGLLANLLLAWIFARFGGARTRPGGAPEPPPPGRTTTRVPGLAKAIDPATPPPGGWKFQDTVSTSGGKTSVDTSVTAPDGTTGSMGRSFDPRSGRFNMDYAFLDDIPSGQRWVQTSPEMVAGRGTPLETYMTMRQMRILEQKAGASFAGPRVVHMSTIVNSRTILQIAAREASLGRPMTTAELNTFVLETHSVQYAQNSIVQTGGRIQSATVTGGRRAAASTQATPAELSAGGVSPTQQVLTGFNIDLNVVPADAPPPPPGPGATPVPVPPGGGGDTE